MLPTPLLLMVLVVGCALAPTEGADETKKPKLSEQLREQLGPDGELPTLEEHKREFHRFPLSIPTYPP